LGRTRRNVHGARHRHRFAYGAQWWLWPDFAGSLACHGYEGQYTVVVPDRELVVVHLGKSPSAQRPIVNDLLRDIMHAAQ
jgi:CubicO group peptidase (beta-lactamase class C family)